LCKSKKPIHNFFGGRKHHGSSWLLLLVVVLLLLLFLLLLSASSLCTSLLLWRNNETTPPSWSAACHNTHAHTHGQQHLTSILFVSWGGVGGQAGGSSLGLVHWSTCLGHIWYFSTPWTTKCPPYNFTNFTFTSVTCL
jgi:hypothetical protein